VSERPPPLKPVQLAYHVPDPAAAAEQAAREQGWGPFFMLEHIPLEWARHRGRPAVFDHSSAYGQGGDVMIEFISQHGDAPSALRDMYAAHERGMHHVATFVPDVRAAAAAYVAAGLELALEARTATGVEFTMVDTRALFGHMVEIYEPAAGLARFYEFVRKAAQGWDGRDPVRKL
jgi:catechol 2,3-dioxygenase-like lactoylglutathione lyase family enzyme